MQADNRNHDVVLCGVTGDSVPSHLRAFLLARHHGASMVRGYFHFGGGDLNGGMIASALRLGNAIEARNFTAGTTNVTISGNHVYAWQKGGIIVNGDVIGTVSANVVGASATQANLAANSVQIGFGARGQVLNNLIEGNTWLGWAPTPTSDWAATAILLYEAAPNTLVKGNTINLIGGNADAGIYVQADDATVTGNRVYDFGPDVAGINTEMDTGIYNYGNLNAGIDNVFSKNKVRCYQDAYNNVTGASNTVLPCLDPTSTSANSFAATSMSAARPASPFDR